MIERKFTKFQDRGLAVRKLKGTENWKRKHKKKPIFCTTLYRKPMQLGNFDGILDQLRNGFFSDGFHP